MICKIMFIFTFLYSFYSSFSQIKFFKSDKEVISSLLTYEHLLSFTNYDPECPMCPSELYQPIPSTTTKRGEYHPELPQPPPELHRFNKTLYTFELLRLLNQSQQALIKFSMLCQTFDAPADHPPSAEQDSQLNDCANMILYSEFLVKLLHMHDKELEFSHADTVMFIEMANSRLAASSNDASELFTNFHFLIANPNIRFKCYCKQISSNCLVLTILPFSYRVVRQLSFIAEPDKRNEKFISKLDGQYGALAVPIFIYKITFHSLSQILLKSVEGEELVKSDNWNLFYDYSLPCNKFYYDLYSKPTYEKTQRPDEIALEDFCKSVEILYWNSFTDSVYKSLQYGFEIDDGDISLVMEKISMKSVHCIDITEFVIYTCKHLKPLVNAYFERFPEHCINDLIDYIFGIGRDVRDAEKFELLKLKDIFSKSKDCINCHPNNDVLKSAFLSYIQTHFTLIPKLASNYYFFDYENIQNVNYRPGGDERAERRKEKLLATYQRVENDETDLCEIMQRGKHVHSANHDESVMMGDVDIALTIKDEEDEGIEQVGEEVDSDHSAFIFSKPFFVGFSYNFSFKNGSQILKTTSIPTCLYELFSAKSDINLEG